MTDVKSFKYYNIIIVAFVICLITANLGATKLWQFGSLILPAMTLVIMILTLTFLKLLYEILVLPITVKITNYLKKVEEVDSFEKPFLRVIFS